MVAQSTTMVLTLGAERTRLRSVRCFCISGIYGMCFPQLIAGFHDANVKGYLLNQRFASAKALSARRRSPESLASNILVTAHFSVIDPYCMMRTDGSAEKSTQPIVHAWCVRVNINATRCNS